MLRRAFLLGALGVFGVLGFSPPASAAPVSLTLRHQHFVFTLTPRDWRDWRHMLEQWTYRNSPAIPPSELRIDGDVLPPLPDGWERHTVTGWDTAAIAAALQSKVASTLDRPVGSVRISRTGSGQIVFDGQGLPGRTVDLAAAADLVAQALEQDIETVILPVIQTAPQVVVTDPDLVAQGIREVVTVGESDFSGSPTNRRHNIGVGMKRFDGHLIARGETFSFNAVLGRVDQTTGYRKELVILGDKTLPDYGGGLCQVSSTAYRGAWEYGFPIVKRKNHSFAVHYYGPQGTDATVYPPNIDMQFLNDSSGALLIQTFIDDHNRAYFVYYGTRDARTTEIVGPYTWGFQNPPPPKTELTADIPPGDTRKVGEAVKGMHAAWFRIAKQDGKQTTEKVSSIYEARPLFHQIGVLPEDLPPPETPLDLEPTDITPFAD